MKYDLQGVATVAGMPGLYKVLKPTRTGVVLESLDAQKKKLMAQTRHKISILSEISIFTTTAESSIGLESIFATMYKKYKNNLEIDHKTTSNDELKAFLGEVVPEFDEDRVYPSDIKKLISWYKIVSREMEPVEEKKKEDKKEDVKAKTETKKPKKTGNQTPQSAKPKKAPVKKINAPKKAGGK